MWMHILVYNIIFQLYVQNTQYINPPAIHFTDLLDISHRSLQVTPLNSQSTMRTPDITPTEPRDHRLIYTYPHGNPECQMSLRTSTKWSKGKEQSPTYTYTILVHLLHYPPPPQHERALNKE